MTSGAGQLARYGSAEPLAPEVTMALDAGIREYVQALHDHGIETYESCEGGAGHAFPEPTIRFHGGAWELFRAYAIAGMLALPVDSLRRVWSVIDGEPSGPVNEIVFTAEVE